MSAITFRGTEYSIAEVTDKILIVFCVLTWLYILQFAFFRTMTRDRFGVVFLCGMMLVFLVAETRDVFEEGGRGNWFDLLLIAVAGIVTILMAVYLNMEYTALTEVRLGFAREHEYVLGALFIITLVYLTYRAYGLVFMLVVATVIFYTMFGNHFPGILGHGGFSWRRLTNAMVWEFQFQGVFGSINQIVATWVALFLLYAGLLRGYGAFDLILRGAILIGNYIRSGVAQAAVTASIIIGSITGSQMANAAITGSFTIPMMKDSGLKPETAGGIESVASSGGQIMPPIMGAAAFVMASVLGISYIAVLIAGLLPALIFYLTVIIAVHYSAVDELRFKDEIDMRQYLAGEKSRRDLTIESVKFLIPFGVLIYTLGVVQWTVMTAALWTVVLMLVTGFAFPLARTAYGDVSRVPSRFVEVFWSTIDGFKYGAVTLAPIAIVVGAINGIVDLLVASGIPGKMSLALLGLSGGVLAVAVVIAMIICIILGLGMPTVAAYVIVAFLIAPALVNDFGIPELAAHYFVFYAAMLSGLTPPIAIAVVVAAGIAQANFWGTCYQALKISAVLFVLPFAFIYNPELVIGGLTVETLISAALALGGGVLIIHGLNYFRRPVDGWIANGGIRLTFFVLGFVALVFPQTGLRAGTLAVGAFLLVGHKYLVRDFETPSIEEEIGTPDD